MPPCFLCQNMRGNGGWLSERATQGVAFKTRQRMTAKCALCRRRQGWSSPTGKTVQRGLATAFWKSWRTRYSAKPLTGRSLPSFSCQVPHCAEHFDRNKRPQHRSQGGKYYLSGFEVVCDGPMGKERQAQPQILRSSTFPYTTRESEGETTQVGRRRMGRKSWGKFPSRLPLSRQRRWPAPRTSFASMARTRTRRPPLLWCPNTGSHIHRHALLPFHSIPHPSGRPCSSKGFQLMTTRLAGWVDRHTAAESPRTPVT